MKRTINFNLLKALAFAALFLAMNSHAFAQDDTTRMSVPPTPSIGQGQSNSTAQDTFFNRYAAQFAVSLAQQTGLSLDKSGKIRDILLDYYNTITDVRRDFLRGMQDARSRNAGSTSPNPDKSGNNQDVTGSKSENNSNNPAGTNAGTGRTDNPQTNTGSPNNDNSGQEAIAQDLMSEYHKADLKADKDILGIFDNKSQKNKYVQIKRQWWQKVKDVVYSTANQNSGGMQTR